MYLPWQHPNWEWDCTSRNTHHAFLWGRLHSETRLLYQRRAISSPAVYSFKCSYPLLPNLTPPENTPEEQIFCYCFSLLSHPDTKWQQSLWCFALTGAWKLLPSVRLPPLDNYGLSLSAANFAMPCPPLWAALALSIVPDVFLQVCRVWDSSSLIHRHCSLWANFLSPTS